MSRDTPIAKVSKPAASQHFQFLKRLASVRKSLQDTETLQGKDGVVVKLAKRFLGTGDSGKTYLEGARFLLGKVELYTRHGQWRRAEKWLVKTQCLLLRANGQHARHLNQAIERGQKVAHFGIAAGDLFFKVGVVGAVGAWGGTASLPLLKEASLMGAFKVWGLNILGGASALGLLSVPNRILMAEASGRKSVKAHALDPIKMKQDLVTGGFLASLQLGLPLASALGLQRALGIKGAIRYLHELKFASAYQSIHSAAETAASGGDTGQIIGAALLGAGLPPAFRGLEQALGYPGQWLRRWSSVHALVPQEEVLPSQDLFQKLYRARQTLGLNSERVRDPVQLKKHYERWVFQHHPDKQPDSLTAGELRNFQDDLILWKDLLGQPPQTIETGFKILEANPWLVRPLIRPSDLELAATILRRPSPTDTSPVKPLYEMTLFQKFPRIKTSSPPPVQWRFSENVPGVPAPGLTVTGKTPHGELFQIVPFIQGKDQQDPLNTYVIPKSVRIPNTVEGTEAEVEFAVLAPSQEHGNVIPMTLNRTDLERLKIPVEADGQLSHAHPGKIPIFSLHRLGRIVPPAPPVANLENYHAYFQSAEREFRESPLSFIQKVQQEKISPPDSHFLKLMEQCRRLAQEYRESGAEGLTADDRITQEASQILGKYPLYRFLFGEVFREELLIEPTQENWVLEQLKEPALLSAHLKVEIYLRILETQNRIALPILEKLTHAMGESLSVIQSSEYFEDKIGYSLLVLVLHSSFRSAEMIEAIIDLLPKTFISDDCPSNFTEQILVKIATNGDFHPPTHFPKILEVLREHTANPNIYVLFLGRLGLLAPFDQEIFLSVIRDEILGSSAEPIKKTLILRQLGLSSEVPKDFSADISSTQEHSWLEIIPGESQPIPVEEAYSESHLENKVAQIALEAWQNQQGAFPSFQQLNQLETIPTEANPSALEQLKISALAGETSAANSLIDHALANPLALDYLAALIRGQKAPELINRRILEGLAYLYSHGLDRALSLLDEAAAFDLEALLILSDLALRTGSPVVLRKLARHAKVDHYALDELWTNLDKLPERNYGEIVEVARYRSAKTLNDPSVKQIIYNLETRVLQGREDALEALWEIALFHPLGGKYLFHLVEILCQQSLPIDLKTIQWTDEKILRPFYELIREKISAKPNRGPAFRLNVVKKKGPGTGKN